MVPRRAGLGIVAAVAGCLAACTAQVSGIAHRPAPRTTPSSGQRTAAPLTGPRNVCTAVHSADLRRIFGAGLRTEFVPAARTCLLTRKPSGQWIASLDPAHSPAQAQRAAAGKPAGRTTIDGHPALLSSGRLDVSLAQDTAAPGDIRVSWVGHDPRDKQDGTALAGELAAVYAQVATKPAGADMCTLLSPAQLAVLFGEPIGASEGTATHCTYRNKAQHLLSVNVWKALPLYANVDVARRRFSYHGHPAQLGNNEFAISLGKTGKSGGIIEALGLQRGGSFPKGAQRLLERLIPYYAK